MGESSLCISPRASVASFVLFKLHKCLNCCIYFRLEALRGHLRSLPLQKRKGQGHCPRYVLLLLHVVYNLFMYLSLHLIAHRVVRWSVTGAVVFVFTVLRNPFYLNANCQRLFIRCRSAKLSIIS